MVEGVIQQSRWQGNYLFFRRSLPPEVVIALFFRSCQTEGDNGSSFDLSMVGFWHPFDKHFREPARDFLRREAHEMWRKKVAGPKWGRKIER